MRVHCATTRARTAAKACRASPKSQAAWLQKKVTQFPSVTNTILVTHQPNMAGAFPELTAGLADGEALIFGSDAKGGAALVARVTIEEWPGMRH